MLIHEVNGKTYATGRNLELYRLEYRAAFGCNVEVPVRKNSAEYKRVMDVVEAKMVAAYKAKVAA